MKINRRLLAYSLVPFTFGLIHCSFYFFYVKVFLNVYKVSEWWFQFSQTIFMIWNAVNDPLIGFLMNNPRWKCSKIRRLPILYGGPIYALTFLVPWFPWGNYQPGDWVCGVHLTVSLCLYDTLFSYIGLTSCCLTAEMFDEYKQRLDMKWYGSLATILSGWSIPFLNIMSHNLRSLAGFQIGAVILAVLAHLSLRYCGKNATTLYEENGKQCSNSGVVIASGACCPAKMSVTKVSDMERDASECKDDVSSWKIAMHILTSRDFLAFICTEFLEDFHAVFWSSFTAIFVDKLVPISSLWKSAFFGSITICPAILYLFMRKPLESYGYYRIYIWIMLSKTILSIILWNCGPHPLLYLAFIFCVVVFAEAFTRLNDIIMSDITDKLMRQSLRSHPNSSVLVGLNAFLTKPAHSLSPMIIVNVLNRYGYGRFVSGRMTSAAEASLLNGVMFTVSCAVPFCVSLLQLVAWSFFSIRSHRQPAEETTA